MILGISSGGRPNGITSHMVKHILESTGQEYKYISLSHKDIRGCTGCCACARTGKCVINDDYTKEIADLMLEADGYVFGFSTTYTTMNAIGHAFLERTFVFRHRDAFRLACKPAVIATTAYNTSSHEKAEALADYICNGNMIKVISKVRASGIVQCLSCGYGIKCTNGKIVKDYGMVDAIDPNEFPPKYDEQTETKRLAEVAGVKLGRAVEAVNRRNRYKYLGIEDNSLPVNPIEDKSQILKL